jgi:hypothetical protein
MVIITQCNEPEWLQDAIGGHAGGREHLSHALHPPALNVEGDLNEVAFGERFGQMQEAAGDGNALESAFCALAIFQHDQSRNGSSELNAGRAPLRVYLGEVGHSQPQCVMSAIVPARLPKHPVRIPAVKFKGCNEIA